MASFPPMRAQRSQAESNNLLFEIKETDKEVEQLNNAAPV